MTVISGGAGTVAAVEEYYNKQLVERLEVSRQVEGGDMERVAGYYENEGPEAQWYGRQAQEFGVVGDGVRREQIRALAEGQRPRTGEEIDGFKEAGVRVPAGEQLGRRFTAGSNAANGRGSVRLVEATFDVDKSVSVMWQAAVLDGDVAVANQIEEALVDSVKAVIDGWEARATTRVTSDGVTRQVPVDGLTVAIIPELTSRAHDPQLHVHTLTQTKVLDPETGKWRALVADELLIDRYATTVKFHQVFEAELTNRLGVEWETNGTSFSRRVAGIPQDVCDTFSKRTLGGFEDHPGMKATLARLISEHRSEYRIGDDVELDAITMRSLTRTAAISSRPDKAELTRTELKASWAAQYATEVAPDRQPGELLSASVGRNLQPTKRVRANKPMQAALEELTGGLSGKSTFTRGELVVAFSKQLPDDLGVPARKLATFIDNAVAAQLGRTELVDLTLNRGVTPARRRYTTETVLAEETRVVNWIDNAVQAGGGRGELVLSEQDAAVLGADLLNAGQLAGAEAIAGTQRLAVVAGPAGTGKTTMAATGVHVTKGQGRQIIGLAAQAAAAQVLGDEIGTEAFTIDKLLHQHFVRDAGPTQQFALTKGVTFLVDEGSMVDTPRWDRLMTLADRYNGRIVAMGDPEQFGAVGRGGMFTHMIDTLPLGHVVELDQVHRFRSEWEKEASLRLRDGDPDVLDTYLSNGRIRGEETLDDAIDYAAYDYAFDLADTTNPPLDIGLFATTNKQVRALNLKVQEYRHAESGDQFTLNSPNVELRNDQAAHQGDKIVTRRNNSMLATNKGRSIANGHTWTVEKILENGSLRVAGEYGRIVLPADYVAEHVDLGYARTDMSSQGATHDRAIVVFDANDRHTQKASLYVSATRGRDDNQIVVAGVSTTEAIPEFDRFGDSCPLNRAARQELGEVLARNRADVPALVYLAEQTRQATPETIANTPPKPKPKPAAKAATTPPPPAKPEPVLAAGTPVQVSQARSTLARFENQLAASKSNLTALNTVHSEAINDYRAAVARYRGIDKQFDEHMANKPSSVWSKGLKAWGKDFDTLETLFDDANTTRIDTANKADALANDIGAQKQTITRTSGLVHDAKRHLYLLDPNYRTDLAKAAPDLAEKLRNELADIQQKEPAKLERVRTRQIEPPTLGM